MTGAIQRLIDAQGETYTIRNASDSGGDRTTPTYSDDGELTGVLERRQTPMVEALSSGDEIEIDLELRAVYDSATTTIREAGETDYPTKLEHPDGLTYRVVVAHPEDSGVSVLSLERE